jgi:hypothetical protein
MVIVLAACGDDDDDDSATPGSPSPEPSIRATRTPAVTPTAKPTPAPTPEPFSGSHEPVEEPGPDVPPVAIHTAVRVAEPADFDQIVFEFDDAMPGYRIEYVQPPILADASGMEVEIAGAAFLQVRFLGADAHDGEGSPTIEERELTPAFTSLVEAELTGDFEAQVTWVLGLAAERDFRVTRLTEPNRVVVDIGHE